MKSHRLIYCNRDFLNAVDTLTQDVRWGRRCSFCCVCRCRAELCVGDIITKMNRSWAPMCTEPSVRGRQRCCVAGTAPRSSTAGGTYPFAVHSVCRLQWTPFPLVSFGILHNIRVKFCVLLLKKKFPSNYLPKTDRCLKLFQRGPAPLPHVPSRSQPPVGHASVAAREDMY